MIIPLCAFTVIAAALFIAVHWFARRRVGAADDIEWESGE